jgi:hypothetical protein
LAVCPPTTDFLVALRSLGRWLQCFAGLTKLTREEMRLAGYRDSVPEIDVCTSGQ